MIIRRNNTINTRGDISPKNHRNSIIIGVIITIFFACVVLFLIKYGNNISFKGTTITELNKTYNGDLIITATDINTINNPEDDEKILVGVRFLVENNSSSPHSIYARSLHCYVDDIEATVPLDVRQYFKDYINVENETLHSTIYPGKIAIGYEVVEAKKTSKQVGFIFDLPGYEKTVSFIFDIPPVE